MIRIGNEYLDTWGHIHRISGYARELDGTKNTDIVHSNTDHFYASSGKSISRGNSLVDDLSIEPSEAIKLWQDSIKQIKSVNSPEKLALVKWNLDNMRKRIKYHEGRMNVNKSDSMDNKTT